MLKTERKKITWSVLDSLKYKLCSGEFLETMCHKYVLVPIHKLYFQKTLYFRSSPSQSVISLCLMFPLDNQNETKKWLKWLFLGLNSSPSHPPVYRLLSMSSLRWGGDVVSRPVAAIGWRTARQKSIAGDICFPEKKRKEILPTSVRDGDRPQLSPAAPIGWQFVQNPTQTTSLTTHQQILKAYMQPPPSLRRCRTASKPHAGAPRLTFIRADVLSLKAAASAWFCAFLSARTLICTEFYYFSWRKPRRQRTLHSLIPG